MGTGTVIGIAVIAFLLGTSLGLVFGGMAGEGKRADLARRLAQTESLSWKCWRAERKKTEKHKQIAKRAAERKREASELLYRLGQEIADFLGTGNEQSSDAGN
jgi:hypothetical protein